MRDLPEKGRIVVTQVARTREAECGVYPRFFKLIKERWKFAQMVGIGQLANEIGRPHQTRIIRRALMIGVIGYWKAGPFNIGGDDVGIDDGMPTEALADKACAAIDMIRRQ